MKRSQVNQAVRDAQAAFQKHGWHLPPNPRWDVTDFGLGQFPEYGLILVNLAEEPEYCEKLMYAAQNQKTPAHTHQKKKEDIIARAGSFAIQLWKGQPNSYKGPLNVQVNNEPRQIQSGDTIELLAGERITLTPGLYHEFWPTSEYAVLGEVSTANDDVGDNFFTNPDIGRFSEMDEDEAPLVQLVSDE